ncbi:hypothetical protein [Oceanobacillus chungangensis]|uniref:Uncharacterized protein n=1 Tax=Oceanobacillus chungangensis TaxID=1229152 RepID=A0A3D8PU76_9BACI|nr:hypothetical protein [Oceanobacillus chungangensis]RDW19666.1 hypothetical protein CWR45_06185 [Oceanobacillus chungangensis]
MEIIILVIILGIASLVNKIYDRVNIDNYSPLWEYFAKSLLYGIIIVFTMLYGKESLDELSPLEWAIVAVSAIEGTGNYINYIKESKKMKSKKAKK